MKRYLLVPGFLILAFVGTAATAQGPTRRPYDDYTRRPSVSPYMNLANNNNGAATGVFMNYQLLVKPQLEQRNFNRQSAAAIREVQQQAAAEKTRAGNGAHAPQKLRSTGHVATRANFSHYYPGLNRQQ